MAAKGSRSSSRHARRRSRAVSSWNDSAMGPVLSGAIQGLLIQHVPRSANQAGGASEQASMRWLWWSGDKRRARCGRAVLLAGLSLMTCEDVFNRSAERAVVAHEPTLVPAFECGQMIVCQIVRVAPRQYPKI